MTLWKKPLAFALTAALALCATLAQAQDAPLRIVVGYAPGGATDRVARIVAEKLGGKLGTPVIVENKTGAGGRLSAQAVKAAPDSRKRQRPEIPHQLTADSERATPGGGPVRWLRA